MAFSPVKPVIGRAPANSPTPKSPVKDAGGSVERDKDKNRAKRFEAMKIVEAFNIERNTNAAKSPV